MAKIYFPGANTGRGFFSRFDGIIPAWEKPHYTYVLKGGPGVGKNTLMRTVAQRAAAKGLAVEEFRCASDPNSFDAVRVPALGVMLLDGTAPHSIDPVLPGVDEEILDLGRFSEHDAFASHRAELKALFAKNKAHYNAAYAMLGAAYALKREALAVASATVDKTALRAYIAERLVGAEQGTSRALFARSATPLGVVDYSVTYLPEDTHYVTGILGEVALAEAARLLAEQRVEVGYDFVDPAQPRTVIAGSTALAVGESGDDLAYLTKAPLPAHIGYCVAEAETLAEAATKQLAGALAVHDAIEAAYRPYVDYTHVNTASGSLLQKLGL